MSSDTLNKIVEDLSKLSVKEAAEFALERSFPNINDLYTDVYI